MLTASKSILNRQLEHKSNLFQNVQLDLYSFQGHYLKETALDQLHAYALCSLYKMTTLERLAEILIVEVDNHALQDEDKSVLWPPLSTTTTAGRTSSTS